MRPTLALALSISLPTVATADMGMPGFSRIPHDFVFEIEADHPDYRFWFVSNRGIEPLELAPGRPVRVDGEGLRGGHQSTWVVAAPVGLVEGMGEVKFAEAVRKGQLPPGVRRSESLHFYEEVPFFDSRSILIDRYRVESWPGSVRLVWLEREAGSDWIPAIWALVGILCAVAALWGGWWVLRRMRRLVREVMRG
jgi:hypothetical protein